MLKANEYYDGKVKSIAFKNAEGTATSGVISPGEYKFSTSSEEKMIITSGSLEVSLNNTTKTYNTGDSFSVPADSGFSVIAAQDCSYICFYL